ncbi:MAG: ABC transporter permease, partial [Pseudomonadota bacterium]|nr:ABC transporter permease [Pseudomonadota bacterium]
MDRVAEFSIDDRDDGGRVLALSGPYLISSVAQIEDGIYAVEGPVARIDLSDVSEIDTVGAWIACDLAREHDAEITGASERAQRLMDAVCGMESDAETSAPREPLGQRIFHSWS